MDRPRPLDQDGECIRWLANSRVLPRRIECHSLRCSRVILSQRLSLTRRLGGTCTIMCREAERSPCQAGGILYPRCSSRSFRANGWIQRADETELPSDFGRPSASVQFFVRCLPCQTVLPDFSSLIWASLRYAPVSPFQSAKIFCLASCSSSNTGFIVIMIHQKIRSEHKPTFPISQVR
jgi:hypothetical protein